MNSFSFFLSCFGYSSNIFVTTHSIIPNYQKGKQQVIYIEMEHSCFNGFNHADDDYKNNTESLWMWCGVAWRGVVWRGVVVEWSGVEWSGVVWCGVVWWCSGVVVEWCGGGVV